MVKELTLPPETHARSIFLLVDLVCSSKEPDKSVVALLLILLLLVDPYATAA